LILVPDITFTASWVLFENVIRIFSMGTWTKLGFEAGVGAGAVAGAVVVVVPEGMGLGAAAMDVPADKIHHATNEIIAELIQADATDGY
jgi:hypothetical protein